MANIAINGFGRIGRLLLRKTWNHPLVNVVAVNDLGDIENLAYLLKHDTVYGKFPVEVSVAGSSLVVGGKKIAFLSERDPSLLPWAKLEIDVVVESSGAFESFEAAKAHVTAGAKHVVLSAPAKDQDSALGKTVLVGVNDHDVGTCSITSNGSCTTNATAPVVQALAETIGVEKALLSTVHAYTATQSIVDGPVRGSDYRRGRAGGENITPSSTGAAIAVARVIPELEGKFDGVAFRVPVPSGSLADITFVSKRLTSVDEVNAILRTAASNPRWAGILSVTDEQLVSSDIVGEPYGAIVDLSFTKVVGGNLVKVLSWYDNEAGYVATLVKHIERVIS